MLGEGEKDAFVYFPQAHALPVPGETGASAESICSLLALTTNN